MRSVADTYSLLLATLPERWRCEDGLHRWSHGALNQINGPRTLYCVASVQLSGPQASYPPVSSGPGLQFAFVSVTIRRGKPFQLGIILGMVELHLIG